MAKIKRGAKLGEIVGKRHPVAAGILLFLGAAIGLSILDFAAGQEIFLKHYFEPFISSTQSAGENICGRFGATFCAAAFLLIGIAAYMIPVYLLWIGAMCFKRSAAAVSKGMFAATLCGLLLFSILCAIIQTAAGDGVMQSASFPSGWGGKFGGCVFDNLLKPFLNVGGSGMLVGTLYFVCMVIVFVDSPAEAAKELGGLIKKTPSGIWKLLKYLGAAIAWLPKKLLSKRSSDDDDEQPVAVPRRVKISLKHRDEPAPQPQAETQAESPEQEIAAQEQAPQEQPATSDEDAQQTPPPEPENAQEQPDPEPLAETENAQVSAAAQIEKPISDFSSRFDDEEEENGEISEYIQETTSVREGQSDTKSDTDGDAAVANRNPVETAQETTDVSESMKKHIKLKQAEPAKEREEKPAVAAPPALAAPSASGDAPLPKIEVVKLEEEKVEIDQPQKKNGYTFPSLDLLAEPADKSDVPEEDYNARTEEIVNVIGSFGVKVLPDHAYPGPVITRYEVKPAPGVKISRIANLEDDITAGIMAQKVRIIAPVPGRGTVGIEVPNKHRLNVSMREVLQSKQWRDNKFEIPIALGKDATGVPIVANLKKMTHALIAGSTNSGKSVCINTIIVSMLYKMTPEDLRLIMIDPKMVELQGYNSIPHMLIPVVSDVKKASAALKWLTSEMMRRYQIFNKTGVRNIDGFNAKILKDKEQLKESENDFAEMSPEERQAAVSATHEAADDDSDIEIPTEKLPYIVCIVDELADLMSVVGKEVEHYIARITQLARAAGIHMIIATQRPDVKVITGLIKNNLPTRIAFKVTSQIDSRTILDRKGAESLIGWGDMLFLNNGTSDPVRAQGAFLSDEEIESIVDALKVNGQPQYAEEVQAQIDRETEEEDDDAGDGGEFGDPMIAKAVGIIRQTNKTSISFLQRKLGVGYNRAANIVEELEARGLIGPDKGQGQRDIFLD